MTKYILDRYAWIEYFDGSSKGEKVKQLIENNSNEIFTSTLSIAEVMIKLLKNGKVPDEAYVTINSFSKSIPVDNEVSKYAAYLYVEKRKVFKDIGIVDVIIMAQARLHDLTIITGDENHFKGEKKVLFLK